MLTSTFCHLPGIGLKKESKLWESGLSSWDDYSKLLKQSPLSVTNQRLVEHMQDSGENLTKQNLPFFVKDLPTGQDWRVFPEFRKTIAYLDIETTGLLPGYDQITTIALYDGEKTHCYVANDNLEQFVEDIQRYRIIVSYNGKTFDIPFIENEFGMRMKHFHLDLRYILRSIGLTGGLKSCERQIGINRGTLTDVDGYFAILLWQEYVRRGSREALETLLAYNIEDVVNLEKLMIYAYNTKLRDTPFYSSHSLSDPTDPEQAYEPDQELIARLKQRYYR